MSQDGHPLNAEDVVHALRRIPCGLFVMTAAFEGNRAGVLTRWVQPCASDPPLIMVAIPTGLAIEPLIRDSRIFALAQISDGERLLRRRFETPSERGDDPFITLPHCTTPGGAPVPDRVHAWFECELIRHVDLDADHRLFVGRIVRARHTGNGMLPAIEYNGCRAVPVESRANDSPAA